jgi:hypothetical protein
VNSSGPAHARNARRLVHAARKEDRRLSAALLAAALAHTPEAEEALRGARTRLARKPAALARELLRNFPKGRRGKGRRRKPKADGPSAPEATRTRDGKPTEDELTRRASDADAGPPEAEEADLDSGPDDDEPDELVGERPSDNGDKPASERDAEAAA